MVIGPVNVAVALYTRGFVVATASVDGVATTLAAAVVEAALLADDLDALHPATIRTAVAASSRLFLVIQPIGGHPPIRTETSDLPSSGTRLRSLEIDLNLNPRPEVDVRHGEYDFSYARGDPRG